MPENIQQLARISVGHDITVPIVDLTLATRQAKARFYERRNEPNVRAGKASIVEKHASRKRPVGRTSRSKTKDIRSNSQQLTLDLF